MMQWKKHVRCTIYIFILISIDNKTRGHIAHLKTILICAQHGQDPIGSGDSEEDFEKL